MLTVSDRNFRGSIANETAIHLDIGTHWNRFQLKLCRHRSRVRACTCHYRLCWGVRLKFREVEPQITVYIGSNLSTFGDANVLAVHEEKKRCCRKENYACRYHATHHAAGVTASFDIFNRSQRRLVTAHQFYVVDVDVELSAPRHSPFGLSIGDRCKGESSFLNY